MGFRHILVAIPLCACLLFVPKAAHAETYQTCAGFIDTLPATISTQGVWCLRHDLATPVASGAAITIAANNVTIDCNDFKIGGLAAGPGSAAHGIHAGTRQNATVRHCNIRGFYIGIYLSGGAGHLVEDNRLDNNLYTSIYVSGDDNRVRRNAVYATGGATGNNYAFGMFAAADITDNTISGVFGSDFAGGIDADGTGTRIEANRVGDLATSGGAGAVGITLRGSLQTAAGNRVVTLNNASSFGISGSGSSFCTGNTVAGPTGNAIVSCQVPTNYDSNMSREP